MTKQDKTLAVGVGEKNEDGLRTRNVKMCGTKVYFRKCLTSDIKDEAGNVVIFMTEKRKDLTNFCEILAVGPDCDEDLNIGDVVVLPECSGENKMWRGCHGEDSEGIIEESEIICIVEEGEK